MLKFVAMLVLATSLHTAPVRRANIHLFNYNPYHDCSGSGVGSMHVTWWVTGSGPNLDLRKNGIVILSNVARIVGDYDLGATVHNGDTYDVVETGTNLPQTSTVASVVDSRGDTNWCP